MIVIMLTAAAMAVTGMLVLESGSGRPEVIFLWGCGAIVLWITVVILWAAFI